MSDVATQDQEPARRSGKAGVILAAVFAVAGAAVGYYLSTSGLLPFLNRTGAEQVGSEESEKKHDTKEPVSVAFVDLPPILISMETPTGPRHLRFHAQIEVEPQYQAEISAIVPRFVDVMNSYMRALSISELQDPLALPRLRAQLLRRLSIVSGKDRVRDLLIMEFVLN